MLQLSGIEHTAFEFPNTSSTYHCHIDLQLPPKDLYHMTDSVGTEPSRHAEEYRSPDANRSGSESQRFDNVRASTNATVYEHFHVFA